MPWDAAGLEKPLLVAKVHSHLILGSVPLGPGLAWEEGSLGLREGGPWPRNTLKGTRGAPAEGGGGFSEAEPPRALQGHCWRLPSLIHSAKPPHSG